MASLARFTRWKMPLVAPYVRFTTQSMPRSPPISQLILVMRIHSTSVEHERLARFHIRRCIFIPNVSVNETRLDASAFALQGAQQSWYTLVQHQLRTELVLWPRRMLSFIRFKDILEHVVVEDLPGFFPAIRQEGRLAMTRRSVKAKLARRGD